MSIAANGKQQKRISSKKNQGLSTAAVYPILQQNQVVKLPNNGIASENALSLPDSSTPIIRGQCIRGRSVAEHTIVTSVAEFVSEVIPQSTSAQNSSQNEPICWVKIQKCPCDFRGRTVTFAVVIGLARGYQIWLMLENGDCEEVASERKGPLRIAHLLPFGTEGIDRFANHRPLFAFVDGNTLSSENKMCHVSFLSLKQGKIVHSLEFNSPIIDMESSTKCFLLIFSESIVVCDHETLSEQHCIVVPPSNDASSFSPCFSLSENLLAFAEHELDKSIQSCGGMMPDEEMSYSGHVMNAAKTLSKTMSSIGESFVSSFSTLSTQCKSSGGGGAAGSRSACGGDCLPADSGMGIVGVVNVNNVCHDRTSSVQYIAHFIAHKDSPIGHLAFGHGGQLLLTGSEMSTIFHLFLLHPHPTCAKLAAVQHIYTLHRGSSVARVIHSAFSSDNRWLSISTNHGTTHVYAITPYGGPICARTHCDKFVNKETKFERSAGFTSAQQLAVAAKNAHYHGGSARSVANRNPAQPQKNDSSFREHPAVIALPTMSRTVVNPRLTYYPPPIALYSLTKIKQRAFSAENLTAWASDNTRTLLGGGASSATLKGNGAHYHHHHHYSGSNTIHSSNAHPHHNHHHNHHHHSHSMDGLVNGCVPPAAVSHRLTTIFFDTGFGCFAVSPHADYAAACSEVASMGGRRSGAPMQPICLYIMNNEGVLTEYKIDIRRSGAADLNNSGCGGGSLTNSSVTTTVSSVPTLCASGAALSDQQSASGSSNFGSLGSALFTAASVHGNGTPKVNEQEKPIRVKVTAAIQWFLRRNRSASNVEVIDPPLSATNSLIQLCLKSTSSSEVDDISTNGADDDQIGSHRGDSLSADGGWLQQVEVVTYSGPHRRMWMGPQFRFSVYAWSNSHSSAQLFNPKIGGDHHSHNGNVSSATAFPIMEKCCPVLIEKSSPQSIGGDNQRIVCGSWSSDVTAPIFGGDSDVYASVKEKIEDAMRDTASMTSSSSGSDQGKQRSKTLSSNLNNMDLMQLSGMDF